MLASKTKPKILAGTPLYAVTKLWHRVIRYKCTDNSEKPAQLHHRTWPFWRRQQVLLKRRDISTILHSIRSLKAFPREPKTPHTGNGTRDQSPDRHSDRSRERELAVIKSSFTLSNLCNDASYLNCRSDLHLGVNLDNRVSGCKVWRKYTGLFISPSVISELDCATTKTDTAERSISIGRESLQVFFCTMGLGVLPFSTAMG